MVKARRLLATVQLQHVAKICALQVNAGRHATAENPLTSRAWQRVELKALTKAPYKFTRLDQCTLGLKYKEQARAV
jgi:hypothetical protein